MTFPDRVTVTDPGWASWVAAFPDIPVPSEFALRWVRTRILRARNGIPDPSLLAAIERHELQVWTQDYARQFSRVHRRPSEEFDVNGIVGIVGGIAGIAVLGFAPAVSMGLAAISVLTFFRKDYRRRMLNERERLADEILEDIHAIELKLRSSCDG